MANECLEIRLPGIATDPNLRKVNETRYSMELQGDGSGYTELNLGCLNPMIIRLLNGNGIISKSNGGQGGVAYTLSRGSNKVYIKLNADDTLCLEDSQNLEVIGDMASISSNSPIIRGNIAEVEASVDLAHLMLQDTHFYGDIAVLRALPKLTVLNASYSYISGKATDLPKTLAAILIGGTKITGKLSDFLTQSTRSVDINNTSIHGELSDFKVTGSMDYINLSSSPIVTGDISDLPNVKGFEAIQETGISFTGNGSVQFTNVEYFSLPNCSLPSSELDNLLIMLSKVTTWSSIKAVTLKGTRTSASDAAISALQNKGVTITINN